MFGAKKSYFRRIFDLRHFYGPNDNLYHPDRKSPGNRLKTAKSVMEQKTGRISQRGRSVLYEKIIM